MGNQALTENGDGRVGLTEDECTSARERSAVPAVATSAADGHARLHPGVELRAGAGGRDAVAVTALEQSPAGTPARLVVQGSGRTEGRVRGGLVATDGDLDTEAAHVVSGTVGALEGPASPLEDDAVLVDGEVVADSGPPLAEVTAFDRLWDRVAGAGDGVAAVVVDEELGALGERDVARGAVPRLRAPGAAGDDVDAQEDLLGYGEGPVRNSGGAWYWCGSVGFGEVSIEAPGYGQALNTLVGDLAPQG